MKIAIAILLLMLATAMGSAWAITQQDWFVGGAFLFFMALFTWQLMWRTSSVEAERRQKQAESGEPQTKSEV